MDNYTHIHLQTIDSTNAYAHQLLAQGETRNLLIDTDSQTAGRGQKGNTWECEDNANLAFTIVCHPTFLPPNRQFALSQAMALAVCETLSPWNSEFTVKWPNDIYWRDLKVSGTLIECDLAAGKISNCIIGTGVNVNQQHFLSDAPNPVSLRQITGHDTPLQPLLHAIARAFFTRYDALERGGDDALTALHNAYLRHLYRRTGLHPYADATGEFWAETDRIEPTGHLWLRTSTGALRRYEFKEVKFLI